MLSTADHEPRTPLEWEQWFITVRQVPRKQHIVEQADGQDRTFYRFLHATCRRRLTTAKAAHQQYPAPFNLNKARYETTPTTATHQEQVFVEDFSANGMPSAHAVTPFACSRSPEQLPTSPCRISPEPLRPAD